MGLFSFCHGIWQNNYCSEKSHVMKAVSKDMLLSTAAPCLCCFQGQSTAWSTAWDSLQPVLTQCSNALAKPGYAVRLWSLESSTPHWLLCSVTKPLICFNLSEALCKANQGHEEHQPHGVPLRNRHALLLFCTEHSDLCSQVWTSLGEQIETLQSSGSSDESFWTLPISNLCSQSRGTWKSYMKIHCGGQERAKRVALYLS